MAGVAQGMEIFYHMLIDIQQQLQHVINAGANVVQLAEEHQNTYNNIRNHLQALQILENINFITEINNNLLILQEIYIVLEIPEEFHAGSMASTVAYVSLMENGEEPESDNMRAPDTPEDS